MTLKWLKCIVLAACLSATLTAEAVSVRSLRYSNFNEKVRVVFDLQAPVQHQVFQLENPQRLVIDLSRAKSSVVLPQPPIANAVIRQVRSGVRDKKNLRVVFDLKTAVDVSSFSLKPNKTHGYRLVVDVVQKGLGVAEPVKSIASTKPVIIKKIKAKTLPTGIRDIVIAIDAGHGGKDPGARGKRGTREKDVVLAIAKKLAWLVNQEPGMRAVMTRNRDHYLKLRERLKKARNAKADLFVSIHADAFDDARVRGSSVYTLSMGAASSEAARMLADKENAAVLGTGVTLNDKDDLLASVLMDLSVTATREASQEVARRVLTHVKKVGKLHKRDVQKAGFVVLKAPDIPSILVETAFISNPVEEKNLASSAHQNRIANGIFKGIHDYFDMRPPPGTRLALKNSDSEHLKPPN